MKIQFLLVESVFKILNFVFENPTKEFYEKKISDITKISVGSCNKYMKKLAEIGFLHMEKRGKMIFYRLNREHGLVKRLKVIFTLSSKLMEEIKNKIKGEGIEIFLYGSFARGEDIEDSDIDILLIFETGTKEYEKIISQLKDVGSKYNKQIKIIAKSRKDWLSLRKLDPAFYERVERDKIRLV